MQLFVFQMGTDGIAKSGFDDADDFLSSELITIGDLNISVKYSLDRPDGINLFGNSLEKPEYCTFVQKSDFSEGNDPNKCSLTFLRTGITKL
jgi:hypothetical protein